MRSERDGERDGERWMKPLRSLVEKSAFTLEGEGEGGGEGEG
jgi:hypothetical protein